MPSARHGLTVAALLAFSQPAVAVPEAPIRLSINPEGRVSVAMTAAPEPQPCGQAVRLLVDIENRAAVTARLVTGTAGLTPPDVFADFDPRPLTGAAREMRTLTVGPVTAATDITVTFNTLNGIADLGNRDRVHFLLTCL